MASVNVPSLKMTLPVGVPAPVTVAVNVIEFDGVVCGFADEVTTVVEVDWPTVRLAVPVDEPPAAEPDPVYDAARLCVPTARPESVTDACPLAFTAAGDPLTGLPLSVNVTVPVGVGPPDGRMTAVKTELPSAVAGDGSAESASVVVAAEIDTAAPVGDTDAP